MKFPDDTAVRVVTALVNDKLQLFRAYKSQYDRDELVSEGVTAALRAWPRFNPQYNPSTFIHKVARDRLRDLKKMADARKRRESRSHEIRPQFQPAPEIGVELEFDVSTPLDRWARSIYQNAKRAYTGRKYRQGRRFFNIAQVVAVAAVRRRLKRSCRETAELLRDDKPLRNALHLFMPPSKSWVAESCKFVEKMGLFGEVRTENRPLPKILALPSLPLEHPTAA